MHLYDPVTPHMNANTMTAFLYRINIHTQDILPSQAHPNKFLCKNHESPLKNFSIQKDSCFFFPNHYIANIQILFYIEQRITIPGNAYTFARQHKKLEFSYQWSR